MASHTLFISISRVSIIAC